MPPPALLVKIAEVAQVDLVWLLTGQGSPDIVGSGPAVVGSDVVQRVAGLLEQRPAAGRAMAAFVELLENVQAVDKVHKGGRQDGAAVARLGKPASNPAWKTTLESHRLIPVLGRAAAASPQFWVNLIEGEGLTNQMQEAVEGLRAGRWAAAQAAAVSSHVVRGAAALVQLSEPAELGGLSIHEMLDSVWLARRWPGAFALRVDGDSMLPMLQANDLVVLAPKTPAVDGEPAVVQLAGQIGVTCKIYRHVGDKVRLIPANTKYTTSVHAARDVVWALQVLARVQVGTA